jgi:hypothetical protein
VYAVAVRVGFAAAVLWVARRRAFPLPIAIVLALVLSALATRLADPILPLVFLLSAAALADDPPPITFDGARTYRFVPANAADGLILRAPSRIDFPRPWQVAPNPRTIAFTRDAAAAIPSGSLVVRFYAMRVRPLRSESSADGAQSPR